VKLLGPQCPKRRHRIKLRFGEHRVLGKQVLEGFRLKDTIRAIDSTGYNPKGGPKESVDQDSYHGLITGSDSLRSFLLGPKGQISPAGYSRFHLVAVVVQQPNLPVQRAVLCQKERTFPREESWRKAGLSFDVSVARMSWYVPDRRGISALLGCHRYFLTHGDAKALGVIGRPSRRGNL